MITKKYSVGIEFRYEYYDPRREEDIYKNDYIRTGIFDDLETAVSEGNKIISILDKYYNRNPNYTRDLKFSTKGGAFNRGSFIISDMEFYPEIKIQFYAKIRALNFGDMGDVENTLLAINKKIGINLKEKS